MDVEEFTLNTPLAGKRSKLAPYRADLLKLAEMGYTLAQMQNFLKLNGIVISCSGIAAYLARQKNKNVGKPTKETVVSPLGKTHLSPDAPVVAGALQQRNPDEVAALAAQYGRNYKLKNRKT